MLKKIFLISLFQLLVFSQGDFTANYKTKTIFDLRKYGQSFVELANSRVKQGQLDIELSLDSSKTEKYEVKLNSTDFKTQSSLKSVGNEIHFGGKKLLFKSKYTTSEAQNLFSTHIKDEIKSVLKKIDSNLISNQLKIKISELSLTCDIVSDNNKQCNLNSSLSVSYKTSNKNKLSLLKNHLFDLKSEMVKSKNDYDIIGYREFLDKCEKLVRDLLETKDYSKNKKLVEVRKMIIDERVDSYEYTAIRSVSITRFVDGVLKHI